MTFQFTVFDDPTVTTDSADELLRIAQAAGCTLTGRVMSAADPDMVMRATAICVREGMKVSNMQCLA